ncbi:hypothetical protein A6R71_16660 [Xanthomonas translucens pv. arrhenatheri]|uniref:Uncharacterized protein n=1 Tax=Xanthomonas graminis pv. arrhenatheri LMG 727 TaxID=1195923 RepID=A0A0K2ZD55_9XANT|nr:hypothetical protein [Xanthomonas translucens]OAX67006.1 hypothetical protein A6R71_16660 [Xanthomonas translucens pv. arrhenatheri]UKE78230.1 hypothetical protein KM317_02995 [Xanthomonas translucens pv. arrhenatheri]CTP83288.1 hypothetical protein XTALMG727_0582 [Xanthomonas translucens pv. arrhenatheri LMG 727]
MTIQTSSTAARGHDMQADDRRAQLAAMLDHADPTARERRESLFREGYDLIVQALARKVPQKTILIALKEAYGLKLHPVRFRELLESETERRQQQGDTPRCTQCSHPIVPVKRVALLDVLSGLPDHSTREEIPA